MLVGGREVTHEIALESKEGTLRAVLVYERIAVIVDPIADLVGTKKDQCVSVVAVTG